MKKLTNFLKTKRGIATVMFSLLMSFSVNAQNLTVTGTVTDPSGEVLIGVSVSVKGDQTRGTATDVDGMYSLKEVPSKGALVFSYVGFQSQEVEVNGRSVVDVTMREDHELLDEVVVIGYGSLSKREVSSSIVQVNSDDFMKGAVNNPMEMLTGKVSGLNVNTTAAANPNGSSNLQIRGATSIDASNGPLIVIDGVPGGDIRTLAPQDIESMSVLKDASSAAIYGTRGADGVILITTKKGKGEIGKPTVTYDSYVALAFEKNRPSVLSPYEWRLSRRGTDYFASTKWYDLITRDVAYDTNQYIGIDGSLPSGGYYTASINYKNANGLDIVSKREEFGGRSAVSVNTLDNHLKLTFTLNARKVKEKWGNEGMFDTALSMNPTIPVYNEDGSYYQPDSPSGILNPVETLKNNKSQGNRTYLLGTADATYNIWSDSHNTLSTTLSYSYNFNQLKSDYYTPINSGNSYWGGYEGLANIRYQKWWTNRIEWLGNYSFQNDNNDLKVLLGYSWEQSNWEQMFMENRDFTFDKPAWNGIGTGTGIANNRANMYAGQSQSKLIGFFGRVNYAWDGQIIASASIRHEGSTKFGKDRKWGNFPAASIAWEMARAPFLRDYVQTVQSLKPRFSYGVTGRSDFAAYTALSTYTQNGTYLIDGSWITGYAPANNANPELGWEKLISFNYGVDFMLFNRLYGSIEYFDRRSQDLLYTYTAPQPPYVYPTIMVNVGTIRNTGLELVLNGDILTSTPLKWSMGVNYSYSTTKLTKLSNDIYEAAYLDLYLKPGLGTSEYFFRVEEGGQIGQFYGYEYAGYDENHNMLVYNKDGEKVVSSVAEPTDKKVIGNGAPKHFLTWTNNLTWKNFDFSMMFTGAFGFDIFNMRRYGMGLQGSNGGGNILRSAYLKDKNVWYGGGVISSYFLEKGDYFKLENITLGYTIPLKNKKVLDSLRVYLSAKNVFTLTKYTGTDPSAVNSVGITPGVDESSAYPQATQLTLGVTLRFR
ncbi:MAG: SusC/RagA family TonB-linked outer membrane protein [Muribaculaceae bacterium]|nr:SusC/RagA family TonB-linked outer membrane protein [Muribaculaceae bacterium]